MTAKGDAGVGTLTVAPVGLDSLLASVQDVVQKLNLRELPESPGRIGWIYRRLNRVLTESDNDPAIRYLELRVFYFPTADGGEVQFLLGAHEPGGAGEPLRSDTTSDPNDLWRFAAGYARMIEALVGPLPETPPRPLTVETPPVDDSAPPAQPEADEVPPAPQPAAMFRSRATAADRIDWRRRRAAGQSIRTIAKECNAYRSTVALELKGVATGVPQ